jgi:hypothetical protein
VNPLISLTSFDDELALVLNNFKFIILNFLGNDILSNGCEDDSLGTELMKSDI